MPRIIGFGHKSRVGKDTAVKFLMTYFRTNGVSCEHLSFATLLKLTTYTLYAWDGMQPPVHYENVPEDRNKKLPTIGKTPVELWIEVGNKLREVYPDTWIKPAITLANTSKCQVVLFSDVRFPNEMNEILESGGKVYKITNSRSPILDSKSDRALDDWTRWDGVIENEGTLKDYYEQIIALA